MRPDQRGAIKLARAYGERLLCVRYRESADGAERLTTVELVLDRVVIQKRRNEVVAFKIKFGEHELRRVAKSKGAVYDPRTQMWRLSRTEVVRMGLKHRIAEPPHELR